MPKKPISPKTEISSSQQILVTAPNYRDFLVKIIGTAPFVSNNFAGEALAQMKARMALGDQGKSARGPRKPKDFEAEYRGSMHVSTVGWPGITTIAFRAAMVRACSMAKVVMTNAKQAFFVSADGYEAETGKPLVRITKGNPKRFDSYVRNDGGGPDIRARAMWEPGWEAILKIQYDVDFASQQTVLNILRRAGIAVGVGAGRPFSSDSVGQGWGTFDLKEVVGQATK